MADLPWQMFGENMLKNQKIVLELRRLCTVDDTPKNTESYFIGQTLKYLLKNTNVKTIIAYADPEYGHTGTIYKASNFELIGKTAKGKIIIYNGKNIMINLLEPNIKVN